MKFRKYIQAFLKRFAPGIIRLGKSVKRKYRRAALLQQPLISKEKLLQDLIAMNIGQGDSIMVHSSLSRIGNVQGGAETVVDALLESVGQQGNVLMPAFTHDTFGKYYLDSNPVFDLRNSPSAAGAITEAFRKRKGVLRSLHPTDSVCAFGPLASYFVSGHFGEFSPYTASSPYYRLAEKQGKILNIGVPLNTGCTNLHTLEDAVEFKFPVYHPKIYTVEMLDEEGKRKSMKTKVHDPAFSLKRKPDELVPIFEKEGVLQRHVLGNAEVLLVDAAKLFESMLRNYKEKGITMYTPQGS